MTVSLGRLPHDRSRAPAGRSHDGRANLGIAKGSRSTGPRLDDEPVPSRSPRPTSPGPPRPTVGFTVGRLRRNQRLGGRFQTTIPRSTAPRRGPAGGPTVTSASRAGLRRRTSGSRTRRPRSRSWASTGPFSDADGGLTFSVAFAASGPRDQFAGDPVWKAADLTPVGFSDRPARSRVQRRHQFRITWPGWLARF